MTTEEQALEALGINEVCRILWDLPIDEATRIVDTAIGRLRTGLLRRYEKETSPPVLIRGRALPPVSDAGLEAINRSLVRIAIRSGVQP